MKIHDVRAGIGVLAWSSLVALPAPGQVTEQWVRKDGGARGASVVTDEDGNVYVTGNSYQDAAHGFFRDIITRKYDAAGNQIWTVEFDPASEGFTQVPSWMTMDPFGDLVITGRDFNSCLTLKYDRDGVLLWSRTYSGGYSGSRVETDAAGNIYVTGPSCNGASCRDYVTIKYDPDGNLLWARTYQGPNNFDDHPFSIAVTPAGEVAVTGESTGGITSFDIATVVYDTDGNQLWVRRYNNLVENGQDLGRDVAFGPNGEVYVGGHTFGGAAPVGSSFDFALIKYDPNGHEEWVQVYDGPAPPQSSIDQLSRVRVDSQGNVVITGNSQQVDFTPAFTTIKYDASGSQVWVRSHVSLGGFGDYPRAMVIAPDDAIYVTGQGGNSQQDYLTIKYDKDGNEEWFHHYEDSDPQPDRANAIAVDADGSVVVTGETPFATIRYVQSGVTGAVESQPQTRPDGIWLETARPNPFRRSTLLRFSVPREEHVRVTVHDVAGRRIATLLDGVRPEGEHAVIFDGSGLASGVYFSVLEAGDVLRVRRVSLVQ